MTVQVGVAPPGRLETAAVVSSLRAHGLHAVQVGPGAGVDVVLVVVHESADPRDQVEDQLRRAIAAAAGRPVLAMLSRNGPDITADVISAGAAGTVDRTTSGEDLARVLAQLARGVRPTVPAQRSAPSAAVIDQLTRRQQQIVDLMVQGLRNEEIGARLGISTHTVRTHVQHILSRLDVQHRHGLASLVESGHTRSSTGRPGSHRQEAS